MLVEGRRSAAPPAGEQAPQVEAEPGQQRRYQRGAGDRRLGEARSCPALHHPGRVDHSIDGPLVFPRNRGEEHEGVGLQDPSTREADVERRLAYGDRPSLAPRPGPERRHHPAEDLLMPVAGARGYDHLTVDELDLVGALGQREELFLADQRTDGERTHEPIVPSLERESKASSLDDFIHDLRALLFGVTPLDPATLVTAAAALLAAAVTAAALPARRASRVDPVVALRSK
jgi:hypothetical protein